MYSLIICKFKNISDVYLKIKRPKEMFCYNLCNDVILITCCYYLNFYKINNN